MSCLFCLPWFRRRRVNQRDTASASPLSLPLELLLIIVLELELADAANFAFINRRLSMLLGPTYWPCLRTDVARPRDRERFLNSFARDLPSWFYCHSCSYLHRLDRVSPPGPFDKPSKPLWCSQDISQDIFEGCLYPCGFDQAPFPYYRILFRHLQLVMRRHHLGPSYGISTDELAFVQVNELDESGLRGQEMALLSVEARVCTEPARLCLRVQRWAVLHTHVLELAVERAKRVGMCVHHNAEEGEMCQLVISSLDEYLTRSEGLREPKRRICRRCNFEYQLEVLDTGSDGLAIVITKWLDLGSGLTPLDRKWRFLTSLSQENDGTDHVGDAERCRLDYEKEEGLEQHAITLRNASYLSKRKYRKTMNKVHAREWILQGGRRRNRYDWLAILSPSPLLGWETLYCAAFC